MKEHEREIWLVTPEIVIERNAHSRRCRSCRRGAGSKHVSGNVGDLVIIRFWPGRGMVCCLKGIKDADSRIASVGTGLPIMLAWPAGDDDRCDACFCDSCKFAGRMVPGQPFICRSRGCGNDGDCGIQRRRQNRQADKAKKRQPKEVRWISVRSPWSAKHQDPSAAS